MAQRLDASSKNRIRSFGHIKLCGALHICWPTKDGIDGQYMVCLLYQDVLCLASAGKADQIYTIQAAINMASVKVEEVDNGRGKSDADYGQLVKGTTDQPLQVCSVIRLRTRGKSCSSVTASSTKSL